MVAFSTLKPGDVLYDCRKQRQGNTLMTKMVCWRVKVIEVHEDHAVCSWNGNTPRKYFPHAVKSLRRSPVKGAQP